MLDLFELMGLLILGVTEGITELLPVSSTGHMIFIRNFFSCIDDSLVYIFMIVVQLGSILSVVIVFRNQLYKIFTNCVINVCIKKHYFYNHLCIIHIFIGTLPGIIFGVFFYEKIKSIFELSYVIYGLLIGNVFLLIGELRSINSCSHKCVININNITYIQSFVIGCLQCLAFCPGFSRSGATIGAGLLVGLNRRVASEFSFVLAIPIILGATVLTIYNHIFNMNIVNIVILFVGCIISFFVSLFTIKFFLKIIQSISFIPFIIYRCILAGVIYIISK